MGAKGRMSGVKDRSEDSLTMRRSKAASSRAAASKQEDPRGGTGGQSSRVPARVAGEPHTGDETQIQEYVPAGTSISAHEVSPPIPAPGAPLSHYKGLPLKNIGRDKQGRTIPHKYSSKVARQIAEWTLAGYDENAICVALNMRPGVLKKLYAKEVAAGAELAGMKLTSHIMDRTKKSDRMAIFVAKAKLGWRDGDGKPTDTAVLDIHIHL